MLYDIGFLSIPALSQLFYLKSHDGAVCAALAKIVDDFLLCGESHVVDTVVQSIGNRFTLGTIVHGPGTIRYFGLNIVQYNDYSVTIDGDDKLNGINTASVTRVRRRQLADALSPAEQKLFASINCSVGWLRTTASPFCATFASIFQQEAPTATVSTMCSQSSRLAHLQKAGTMTNYLRPDDNLSHSLSIVVFRDAGRLSEAGQLCQIGGLMIDDLAIGSIFHTIVWSSQKSPRPVRSTGAAETIAAGEGIELGKSIAHVYKLLLQMEVHLVVAVDSKDLYTTLTTKRQSIYRSIRGDVGVIRFEFEVQNVSEIVWIPGRLNPADIGTKFDSQLTSLVSRMLSSGKIPFNLDKTESCLSNRSPG